ncbi:RNA-binding S4 domain-containing protein [Agarivorans litoreus]|uniref:RNA-binding S4 domain-containing protein n=1 Tax=Agarivorans litoreus TaxID=1510455 RepID=UPI001C7DAAD0|nr:RNA-binding S4 domain-containing protein [Agarivorans litoreus]
MTNQEDSPEEIEVEATEVYVDEQPIELYKVLKIGNLVNGGGEAKMAIAEGYVGLNGELEQRKRKKVYADDIIEYNGQFLYVVCDQPITEPEPKSSAKKGSNKQKSKGNKVSKPSQKSTAAKQPSKKQAQRNAKTGRHSIKF